MPTNLRKDPGARPDLLKTRDEMQDLVKEVSEKGKLSEEEGREFLDEILNKCDEARESFEENVDKTAAGGGMISIYFPRDIKEMWENVAIKCRGKAGQVLLK